MAIEVKVPDIGDFKDVPVITVFVKPGDVVRKDDPLVELESDKATMEVPSPAAGKVASVSVKEGDKVAEGVRDPDAGSRGCGGRAGFARRGARHRRPRSRAGTCTARSWCSAPAPAATPPPSGRPTSARRWC